MVFRRGLELRLPRDPWVSQMAAASPGPDGPADGPVRFQLYGLLAAHSAPASHHLIWQAETASTLPVARHKCLL